MDHHSKRLQSNKIIRPAVEYLKKEGIKIDGPIPADTAFIRKYINQYDVIHTMYHDQGLPVIKYDDFSKTTNVTLGLPIVRVSVDHGTADDIVGKNIADPSSMKAAIELAIHLVDRKLDRFIQDHKECSQHYIY